MRRPLQVAWQATERHVVGTTMASEPAPLHVWQLRLMVRLVEMLLPMHPAMPLLHRVGEETLLINGLCHILQCSELIHIDEERKRVVV